MSSIAVSAGQEELDEFAAAMAFFDQGMDVTGEQIDERPLLYGGTEGSNLLSSSGESLQT